MRNPVFAVLCGAALFVACATAARTTDASGSQMVILRAELESRPFTDVYHAIQTLRRSWLRRPGGVYVDNVAFDVDWLRDAQVAEVERIELVPGRQAMSKWGNISSSLYSSDFIHVIRRR